MKSFLVTFGDCQLKYANTNFLILMVRSFHETLHNGRKPLALAQGKEGLFRMWGYSVNISSARTPGGQNYLPAGVPIYISEIALPVQNRPALP
jgi:hypothetical protein